MRDTALTREFEHMRSQWLRDLSIRHKLTLLAALPCLVLLMPIPLVLQHEISSARSSAVSNLETTAESLGYSATAALSFRNEKGAERILGSLSANPHIMGAVLYDASGQPFATYQRAGSHGRFVPPAVHNAGSEFGSDTLDHFHVITL